MVKNQEGIYFVYRSTRQVYKVRITDIMYFARSGRRVTMYSRELGAVELYCSLSEIYELLFSDGFYYINKSVIVNLFHITNIKNNFARIADGNCIEISRARRTFIMHKYCETQK